MDPVLSQYRRDGYVVLRALFPPWEADSWRSEAVRLRGALPAGAVRLPQVRGVSPHFSNLIQDERILSAAASLLLDSASPGNGELVVQPPGDEDGLARLNPSREEARAPADGVLSVMLPLEAGGAEFFAGLHHARILWRGRPGGPGGTVPEEALRGMQPSRIELEPGDAVLIHSLTPHRTGFNPTPEYRHILLFTYAAARYDALRDSLRMRPAGTGHGLAA